MKSSIEWAIRNMTVCFIPAGVGIINHFELIKHHGISMMLVIIISTFILLTFVGYFFEKILSKNIPSSNSKNKLNH